MHDIIDYNSVNQSDEMGTRNC